MFLPFWEEQNPGPGAVCLEGGGSGAVRLLFPLAQSVKKAVMAVRAAPFSFQTDFFLVYTRRANLSL